MFMQRTHVLRRGVAALTTLLLAASGVSLVATTASAAGDVGFVGPSYTGTQQPNAPTAEKPQSKLWFAAGKWWGALWDTTTNDYHVFGYDWAANTWNDTGTVLETRTRVDMDTLWDGTHLYVLSTPKGGASIPTDTTTLLRRYSFVNGAWSADDVTPVTIASGLIYSPVIDKDSTGVLWVTYTTGIPGVDPAADPMNAATVMITHSTVGDDRTWVTPYQLPTPDDSSTVTFDPVKDPGGQPVERHRRGGLLRREQDRRALEQPAHREGALGHPHRRRRRPDLGQPSVAYNQPKGADDHLNIKSVAGGDAGRVFAVAKTSHTAARATR